VYKRQVLKCIHPKSELTLIIVNDNIFINCSQSYFGTDAHAIGGFIDMVLGIVISSGLYRLLILLQSPSALSNLEGE
jgi:hypothetical protein